MICFHDIVLFYVCCLFHLFHVMWRYFIHIYAVLCGTDIHMFMIVIYVLYLVCNVTLCSCSLCCLSLGLICVYLVYVVILFQAE